ncbi:MAG: hypothetical protein GX622_08560 [Bacteroidales bacterium]|nr:hypothetical protein [Bacteroidales bacterium]
MNTSPYLVPRIMYRILIICLIMTASCSSPEKLLKSDKGDRIFFGSKGGFTNMSIDFVLFENGSICRLKNDIVIKTGKISKEEVREIEATLEEINFMSLNTDEPGNMTYYVSFVRGDSRNAAQWSDHDSNPQLRELYVRLMNLVKE